MRSVETPGPHGEAVLKPEPRPASEGVAPPRRRRWIMPEDPLARWLVWFCIVVSVVVPAVAALVLALLH